MSDRQARKAGALEAARAVLWGFLGVRRRSGYESDAVRLTVGQVIAMGLIGAVLFIALLLGLVYIVTRLGPA